MNRALLAPATSPAGRGRVLAGGRLRHGPSLAGWHLGQDLRRPGRPQRSSGAPAGAWLRSRGRAAPLGVRPDPELHDSPRAVADRRQPDPGERGRDRGPRRRPTVCQLLADAGRASAARSTDNILRAVRDAGGGLIQHEAVVLALKSPGSKRDPGQHSAGWPGRGRYAEATARRWPGRGRVSADRNRYPSDPARPCGAPGGACRARHGSGRRPGGGSVTQLWLARSVSREARTRSTRSPEVATIVTPTRERQGCLPARYPCTAGSRTSSACARAR